jgi:hypothetical protein
LGGRDLSWAFSRPARGFIAAAVVTLLSAAGAPANTTTSTAYAETVLADTPAGYWRLDETGGASAADASGNGNAGSYQNGPTLGAPTLISGGSSSVRFDGVDDRVLVPSSAALSPTAAVSVEAWVNADSLPTGGGYRTIVIKGATYWLRVRDTGSGARAQFYVHDGGGWRGTTAALSLTAGTTYHLLGSYDGAGVRIYVNGSEQGSSAYAGAIATTSTPLQIAQSAGVGWQGRIDEVAVYGRALNAAAVERHHRRGVPPTYAHTVLDDTPAGYWRLDETGGASAADASGNGNAGSYQNGPTLGAPTLISGGSSSVRFDGVDDRVLVPSSAALSPTAAVSVEAWVNADSLPTGGGYRTIVIKGATYWLRVRDTGSGARAQFYVHDGGGWRGTTAALSLTAGTTYHLLGSYDGAGVRIYVNGSEQGSSAYAGAIATTSTPLQIAQSAGVGWQGRIDEVAVYGRALNAATVSEHFGAARPMSIWDERGIFTWYLPNPLVSDSAAFAERLKRNNFAWVAVQAHWASSPVNAEYFAEGWLEPLRKAGLEVCAWGPLGENPEQDAAAAMEVVDEWKFDCYIANAEAAYKSDSGGDPARSGRFVSALKLDVPLALSTYGAAYKPWNLAAVFDYVPWQNAGYHLLPQAYWNVCECYEPLWVIEHSLEAGWPIERVHPTVGIFDDGQRILTGADYAPLLAQDGATGFSAYLAEEMSEADYAALSAVR